MSEYHVIDHVIKHVVMSGSFYRSGRSLTTSLTNEDVPPSISEGNSESRRLDAINSKLDSLLKMMDEQKRAEIDMKQDITNLKKSVEAFKEQQVPVNKIAVKKKIPTDLSVC